MTKSGARHKALITFTFNRVSQGLYIRHGMFPRLPIYFFSAPREGLAPCLPAEGLRLMRIEDTAAHLRELAAIDASALGFSREKHHKFLIGDAATKDSSFTRRTLAPATSMSISGGHVGPFAVVRPEVAGAAFVTALHLAAGSGTAQVSAFIPGVAEAQLGTAARTRDADHLSDGVDVVACLRRLDALHAAQSGIYVSVSTFRWMAVRW